MNQLNTITGRRNITDEYHITHHLDHISFDTSDIIYCLESATSLVTITSRITFTGLLLISHNINNTTLRFEGCHRRPLQLEPDDASHTPRTFDVTPSGRRLIRRAIDASQGIECSPEQ